MSFRQWRVAVVVMLSNIFHSSVTIVINREGWDKNKNIPSYTGGMVDNAKFSKTCFKNQRADVKGYFVVDHLILRGGGLADKKMSGQIIHFQHGSGAGTFPDFFIRKTSCSTFDF